MAQTNVNITVDGKKIATQTLNRNLPDKFFDMEYKLPAELTKGKEKVTVRFEAQQNSLAGGVFECATLKAK